MLIYADVTLISCRAWSSSLLWTSQVVLIGPRLEEWPTAAMEKCCWGLDPGCCTEETCMEPFSHHGAIMPLVISGEFPDRFDMFRWSKPAMVGMGSPPWLISGGRLLLSRGSSPQIHQENHGNTQSEASMLELWTKNWKQWMGFS